jgi:hypothetical protein
MKMGNCEQSFRFKIHSEWKITLEMNCPMSSIAITGILSQGFSSSLVVALD